MVRQNSSEDVERVTGAAIAALSDLERAVSLATQLRAIGPATASGKPPPPPPLSPIGTLHLIFSHPVCGVS